MAPLAPSRGRAHGRQRFCARTCSGAGGWGGDVRRRPAHGGRSTPGPTPPSSHPENPEVEEEARRRWQSGQELVEPYPAACLGLGAGGGAEWPGQSGLDRAGEAMASAELQGKYQKLAQEYSKVPVVCGE